MKRFFKIFFTLLLLIAGVFASSKCLKRYDTYSKFGPFFKDKKSGYDVYFLGSSHVLNGVFPMNLWEDYGIRGYNMGWNTTPTATSYWQLKLSSRIHKPKYAFIDIYLMDQNVISNEYAHQIFDYFPFNSCKNEALVDMFPSIKDRIEYYLPFIYYHSNWSYLGVKAFTKLAPCKGADLRIDVSNSQVFLMDPVPYEGKESIGLAYAEKIIEFCRENDIVPVFFCVPYPEQDKISEWKDALLEILKKKNAVYLEIPEGIVDYETDMYDQNSHLNPSGAKKVTDYIGRYIVDHLGFSADYDKSEADGWNEDLKSYRNYYDSKILEEEKLENVLMLLNDRHYAAEIICGRELSKVEEKLADQIPFCKLSFDSSLGTGCLVKISQAEDGILLCEKKF